jgi:rubrerythrin
MTLTPSTLRDAALRSAHRLILGQAITGELVAIENYARMIPLASSTDDKLALLDEAVHERAHIRILHGLGKVLGLGAIDGAVFDPYWTRVRTAMDEIVARSDLDAARFVQDFVLESYAVTLYRAVAPHVESVFRRKLEAIADDEQAHLVSGIAAFAKLLASDRARAFGILDFGHRRVARVLAEWIAPSECRPLCGVCGALGDRCGKPLLQEIQLDTNRLAADFADVYGGALREAGLSPAEALRYVAELIQ